jgi:hypothetical protein
MTTEERIAASIGKNPGAPNHIIAKNIGVRAADVQAVRDSFVPSSAKFESDPNESSLSGIALTNKQILSHKPAETAALFIQRLPKGRGFLPAELSKKWHLSEETIKNHAKRLGCLKYLNVGAGNWVQVVINPETAEGLTE